MTLEAGSTWGQYEIVGSLGAGGMGEVYRARDTKLGREVAIKVLPDGVARDPERLARFEREARALAALNHPNIATLHGMETHDGAPFLVMEVVEGPTLAERIAEGPLPVEEARAVFLQIAEGLEAAHERGIVHRDLKPSNVKLTGDFSHALDSSGNSVGHGAVRVKILDFGLATALADPDTSAQDPALSVSPTLTLAATQRGEILGTAPYMSPEQARGKPVDRRTDVWAFGVCLFEASTGRRAFDGGAVAVVLSAVLQKDPPWECLPRDFPSAWRRLLRRCLTKDPRRRLHHVADARLELEESVDAESVDPQIAPPPSRWSGAWAAGIAVAALALGSIGTWLLSPPRASSELDLLHERVTLVDESQVGIAGGTYALALAPDGGEIVFTGRDRQGERLYRRRLTEQEVEPIDGTEGGSNPFFSPDGQWLGFHAGSELFKVPAGGGKPIRLGSTGNLRGASWAADGTIYFGTVSEGLYRIDSAGGEREKVDVGEGFDDRRLQSPAALDERGLAFSSVGVATDDAQIAALSFETGETVVLAEGTSPQLISGQLVFARGSSLFAAPLAPKGLSLAAEPRLVLDGAYLSRGRYSQYTVADDGAVAIITWDETDAPYELVWIDRRGGEEPLANVAPESTWFFPRISHDGERIAASVRLTSEGVDRQRDLWIYEIDRELPSRLTFAESADLAPVWATGDEFLLFASVRSEAGFRIWRRRADGTGIAQDLGIEGSRGAGYAVVPGSDQIVFTRVGAGTSSDLYLFDPGAEPSQRPLVTGPGWEAAPELSPDGRWLLYKSERSLRVRPFPEVDAGAWEIPLPGPGGPFHGAWSRSTSEVFLTADSRMWSVPFEAEGASFRVGSPVPLFSLDVLPSSSENRFWDATPDAQRFVVSRPRGDGGASGRDPVRIELVRGALVPAA